ncbi:MAG: thioredoxin family protein [Gemmataceae bacterium]
MQRSYWFCLFMSLACLPQVTLGDEKDTPLWLTNFEEAKKTAAKNKLDILMLFTGSDWCPPCIRLERGVLETEEFKTKVPKHFVLLVLDNPRNRTKITKKERIHSLALRGDFYIESVPTVILTDARGIPYAHKKGYSGQAAKAYVSELLRFQDIRKERDTAFDRAAKAQGLKRAKFLGRGLANIHNLTAVRFYRKTVEEIVSLDPNDKEKLRSRYRPVIQLVAVKELLTDVVEMTKTQGPKKGIAKLDAFLKHEKLEGELLQQVLFLKGLYESTFDKQVSKQTLERARDVDPNSEWAQQIQAFLKSEFGEKDQSPQR